MRHDAIPDRVAAVASDGCSGDWRVGELLAGA
jgi:hypothetical protein